jgi:hypothetical protein
MSLRLERLQAMDAATAFPSSAHVGRSSPIRPIRTTLSRSAGRAILLSSSHAGAANQASKHELDCTETQLRGDGGSPSLTCWYRGRVNRGVRLREHCREGARLYY